MEDKVDPKQLEQLTGLAVFPSSIVSQDRAVFFLGQVGQEKRLGVIDPGQV